MKAYEDYEKETTIEGLKFHPRLVELDFILLYGRLKQMEGVAGTCKILETLSDVFNVDYQSLKKLIDSETLIKRNRILSKGFWYQECIVLGLTQDYSMSESFVRFLGYKKTYHNQFKQIAGEKFINEGWITRLNKSVCFLNDEKIYKDVKRFMDSMESFRGRL